MTDDTPSHYKTSWKELSKNSDELLEDLLNDVNAEAYPKHGDTHSPEESWMATIGSRIVRLNENCSAGRLPKVYQEAFISALCNETTPGELLGGPTTIVFRASVIARDTERITTLEAQLKEAGERIHLLEEQLEDADD